MIPLRLNLRNFMSYTDVHEPLRFDGIHVAVLSGDNGHGKSALLDAVTWALWGRARARSVDDLIHTGATEMEVEFEFLLDEQRYRVIRKRQKRGKSGLSDLQFAIAANGTYRPLTERSILETERAIERTLRMSYETFTSSSFIQQGRADSFTMSPPAERKRILAEILELGAYDELEARAKDLLRQREQELRDERARVQEWQRELDRRAEYQADLERVTAALAALEEQVRASEAARDLTRERVARFAAAEQELERLTVRLERLTGSRERGLKKLADTRASLAEQQGVLDRADDILRAVTELRDVRKALEAAERAQETYLPLAQARLAALSTLEKERARLEAHLTALVKQVTDLKPLAEQRATLEAEQAHATSALAELSAAAERERVLRTEAVRAREEHAEKRAVNQQYKDAMHDLKAKIEEMESLATCPTCQRALDPAHKTRLRGEYEAQGRDLATRYRENGRRCAELEALVAEHDAELERLAQQLAGRDAAQRYATTVEGNLAQARHAAEQLASVQQELAEHEAILAEQRFAQPEREQLRQLERQLAALAYDEAHHRALRARASALAAAETEASRLDQARLTADHLAAQEREILEGLASLENEITAEQQQREQLCAQLAGAAEERAALARLEQELATTQGERDRVRDERTQTQGKLDYCAYLDQRLSESAARQDALIREQNVYADLVTAFGKKGVQAMIIETAIPEIEDEANRLLARMTDGRMHVKLETQRDTRTGTGTIETLDIKIADELGTRSYEMFSGGESFRVNFAIRIALSKLLARRAGTRLQLLVIDEGFGSQDAEGRDRIVEAIQTIQEEFEKILVITHLDDLRDRFPVRIEVQKTAQGSVYSLR